jgi:hypothetical protein
MSSMSSSPVVFVGRRKRPVVAIVLVFVLGVAAAGVLLTAGIVTAIGKMPTPDTAYPLPGPATIRVDAPGEWALYLRNSDSDEAKGACTVNTGEGTAVPVESPFGTVQSGDWFRTGTFRAQRAGDYTVKCRPVGGADAVGVAERPDVRGFVGWLVGGILGSIALLGVTIAIGLYLALKPTDAGMRAWRPLSAG